MTQSKKDLLIYTKQLEDIIRRNNQLHGIKLKETGVGKDQIVLELETELDEKFLISRAKSLAKLRFRDRKVSSAEFKDGKIKVNFFPRKGG